MAAHTSIKHPLHHTREIEDMRQNFRKLRTHDSPPSSQASHSGSDKSEQPTRTQEEERPTKPVKKAPRVHYHGQEEPRYFEDRQPQQSPKSSVETYASTVQSEDDLQEPPEYVVPEYSVTAYKATAVPATPTDFSELFPSRRRLLIRHDDSTLDGNLNLRLDTPVDMASGQRGDMTLFHLRMHDLRTRSFSLRRYCRDSGREVCHCTRKEQKAGTQKAKRPNFQRSLSNAISSMRPKSSDQKSLTSSASLKRNDSGYGSLHSVDLDDDRPRSEGGAPRSQAAPLTDTVRMEFSNYAQVDVKQAGSKASRRYEFEYWGVHYSWKRVVRKEGQRKDVSFHLTQAGSDTVLGYIVPASLTPVEAEEEQSKGGWIPPCSMWIADQGIVRAQKDVSDVVISAGLIALVDDSIKTRFLSKHAKQVVLPKLPLGVEYVGPKRLINEMFKRERPQRFPSATNSSRPQTSDASSAGTRTPGSMSRQQSGSGK